MTPISDTADDLPLLPPEVAPTPRMAPRLTIVSNFYFQHPQVDANQWSVNFSRDLECSPDDDPVSKRKTITKGEEVFLSTILPLCTKVSLVIIQNITDTPYKVSPTPDEKAAYESTGIQVKLVVPSTSRETQVIYPICELLPGEGYHFLVGKNSLNPDDILITTNKPTARFNLVKLPG